MGGKKKKEWSDSEKCTWHFSVFTNYEADYLPFYFYFYARTCHNAIVGEAAFHFIHLS